MSQLKQLVPLIAIAAIAVPVLVAALPKGAFVGQPALAPGSATGGYVWTDADGLHARFTSKRGPVRFHGKVCTTGRIAELTTVTLEAGDSAAVGPRGHCVLFNFLNNGQIDGLDFKATGKKVSFDFKKGQQQLPPSKVWIGENSLHPPASPFQLVK
jgi:hypothetical protein